MTSEARTDAEFVAAVNEAHRGGYRAAVVSMQATCPDDLKRRLLALKPMIASIYGPLIDQTIVALAAEARSHDGEWEAIDKLSLDGGRSETVVFGYFGPEQSLFGAKAVGYMFQWPKMPRPLASGWALRLQPTHFARIPALPLFDEGAS